MKTELKPCPFCGGEAKLYTRKYGYRIECKRIDCGACTGEFDSREEAIEAWNWRFEHD